MFSRRHEERIRIAALKMIELFSDCNRAELRAIDAIGSEIFFRPGKKLTCQGAGGVEFMVIVAGDARVTRDGRELAALGPGAFFGELSLIAGAPRNATVAATTELRALVLHAGEFAQLLEIASVKARIMQTAAERAVVRPRLSTKRSRVAAGALRGIPA